MEMILNWNSNLKNDDDMKKIFSPILAMTIILAGCAKNEIDAPASVQTDAPEYVTASFEPMTKAHLVGNSVIWNSADQISLYAKTDAQQKYVLDTYVDENDKTLATFKYEQTLSNASEVLTKNYAIFPYRKDDNKAAASGVLTTRIKNNQDYFADKLLICAPMVAVADDYNFQFRNVASVIRFNVKKEAAFTDECVLTSIELRSKTKTLSGLVTVDTNEETWVAVPTETSKNVLVKGNGINAVLTTEAQPFCIVVPPATYPAEELTIKLTYNNDQVRTIVYPDVLEMKVNCIQDINCTIKAPVVEDGGIVVVTGGLYEFNGHPHLTCHTASVVGGYTGTQEGVTVTEVGVLFQRSGKEENLLLEKVGTTTNDVRQVKASELAESVTLKMSDLVGGSDGATKYLYRFYVKLSDATVKYGASKEIRTDVPGFVEVKAGTFRMGADSGENGYNASYGTAPAHMVTLTKDFEIGKYEVTVPEFVEFLNECPSVEFGKQTSTVLTAVIGGIAVYNGNVKSDSGSEEEFALSYENGTWKSGRKKFPIQRVTKYGADQYCKWLTESLNDGYTYRLPTEAEWEYAARGGNLSKGYKFSGSNTSNDVARSKASDKSGYNSISRIGERYPNELGIYDMSGNMFEFVSDRSDKNWKNSSGEAASYFMFCRDGVQDPTGPTASDGYSFDGDKYYFIQKGGSSNEGSSNSAFCPGYRRNDREKETYNHVCGGFRVVRVKNN